MGSLHSSALLTSDARYVGTYLCRRQYFEGKAVQAGKFSTRLMWLVTRRFPIPVDMEGTFIPQLIRWSLSWHTELDVQGGRRLRGGIERRVFLGPRLPPHFESNAPQPCIKTNQWVVGKDTWVNFKPSLGDCLFRRLRGRSVGAKTQFLRTRSNYCTYYDYRTRTR